MDEGERDYDMMAMQSPGVFPPVVDVSEHPCAEFDDACAGLGASIGSGRGTTFPANSPETASAERMQPRSATSDSTANDIRTSIDSNAQSAAARHRSSPEPRGHFVCRLSGCGNIFTRLSFLQEHQSRHANGLYYACTEGGCHLRFITLSDLRRHLKMMHDKITTS